ncbi:alpha/beta hydrolase fold domain-containing protein [Endozoicomonas sp. G2_2]|uniref:alpha/beta hydrolase n=2 Tax=Gammaproteobacteria TaxID=1236 RepID=UPI001ADC05B4|nr:alpha/beta fold hydrolase [Endozoicomonas sp. G2_2]MBO9469908.1 alpha/beta hydrolase fold domain-containing protein [Endozoicomonas sp. G2_2]
MDPVRMLDCIEIEPNGPATASVIWLHGLGADGNDFVPIVDELGLPADHGVRFVFPNAPVQPVTINNGMPMRAWYDIKGMAIADKQDAEGIRASAREIEQLIDREGERGIAPERIVLAGFSQGGAIALHTGLRHARGLAGIMALSTYLPLAETLGDEASDANRGVSILQAHGSQDPVVPMQLGQASRDHMLEAGYDVAWHEYPMQHQVCMPQIATIGRWLTDRLPA